MIPSLHPFGKEMIVKKLERTLKEKYEVAKQLSKMTPELNEEQGRVRLAGERLAFMLSSSFFYFG